MTTFAPDLAPDDLARDDLARDDLARHLAQVRNECTHERVVFQVVIRHPQLQWGEDAKTHAPLVMDAH